MDIRLDKKNPIPIGVQVKEQIKMLVNSGEYKEGDKLPSINQLASFLGVNKNTIVSVLKDLENEGYVESHRGKGVFISRVSLNKGIDPGFMNKVDLVIAEAKERNIDVCELVNLISARFSHTQKDWKTRVLFVMGITQELVDVNLKKLRENITTAEFRGLLMSKELTREKADEAFEWAELIVIPAIVFDYAKDYLPVDKPVVKTMANLKLLASLNKGIEKKSKVAVVGGTEKGTQALAKVFVEAKLFRPKLLVSRDNIDEYKKELKEIDSIVVCLSARDILEKINIKDKDIYVFSDYIDGESIQEIKSYLVKMK